jgi:PTH1 family peptidyl-tRNA hydrolase
VKLVVFLGNPGRKYQLTRHNAGFLFADFLAQNWQLPSWRESREFKASFLEYNYQQQKLILLKPLTFMNLSGQAVARAMAYYGLDVDDLLVTYDDKDLEFNKVRFRTKGSSGGHNGIKDLIRQLDTEQFSRIKIGVNNLELKPEGIDTAAYVLSKFQTSELEILEKAIFPETMRLFVAWLKGEL